MQIVDALQRNTAAKIGVNGSENSLSNLKNGEGCKKYRKLAPQNQKKKSTQLLGIRMEFN